jgi:hypothetical protein
MGATEDAFAELARADGIDLRRGVTQAWLTNAGHLSVVIADHLDESHAAAIRSIYLALGGDETLLAAKRSGSDPRLDFLLEANALAVEVDEIQHFTTDRLRTLDLYPPNAEVCFDINTYRTIIDRWSATGDRYRASKPTVDFPFAGGTFVMKALRLSRRYRHDRNGRSVRRTPALISPRSRVWRSYALPGSVGALDVLQRRVTASDDGDPFQQRLAEGDDRREGEREARDDEPLLGLGGHQSVTTSRPFPTTANQTRSQAAASCEG